MRVLRLTTWKWSAAAAAAVLAFILGGPGCPTVQGAGVAAFKEQPFHSDDLATIIVYSKIRETAASYQFDLGTKEMSLDRSKIVGHVTVPELPANICDQAATAQLRQSFAELNAFAARYKKAIPVLKPYAEQLKTAIARYEAGNVRLNSQWISSSDYAVILQKEQETRDAIRQRDMEAQKSMREAAERRAAFAAEQRSKGLVEYRGAWLPAAEVQAIREREAELVEAREQVDKKSIRYVKYEVVGVNSTGMLVLPLSVEVEPPGINLDMIFLHGAVAGAVAQGDTFADTVFWCGTYSFNTKSGRMTVHAFTSNQADAVEQVRATLFPRKQPDGQRGPAPEMAQNPPEAPEDEIPAVLRDYDGYGSGFFVGDEGYFVTNAHVVGAAAAVDLYYEEKKVPARVLYVDKGADLAVLKADIAASGLVLAVEEAEPGTDVYVVGFPRPTLQGIDVKVTKGIVSSKRAGANEARFQIDAAIQPGNSGGALCDDTGRVRGVVVATLNPLFVMKRSGSLPQNVNYAIKTSELAAFLRSKSVKFQQSNGADAQGPRGIGVKMVCAASGLVLVKE